MPRQHRILIVNGDYGGFLKQLYSAHPGLDRAPYAEQMRVRNDSLFGQADFYSKNLRDAGHEAWEVHVNNEPMQRAWAAENGMESVREWRWRLGRRAKVVPWPTRSRDGWTYHILQAQIRHYRPTVIVNHELSLSHRYFRRLKRSGAFQLLIGQHAAMPLPRWRDWGVYDLGISSFPPTLDWFRARGVEAKLFRLGFEATIPDRLGLGSLPVTDPDIPVSFVGSFEPVHRPRTAVLEHLVRCGVPLQMWGPVPGGGWGDSPLQQCHRGQAYGRDMLSILARSRITVNHHGAVPPFANNMRLYEATGVASLLVTDDKPNLPEMFEPGTEVVAYQDATECAKRVRYYLDNDAERREVAAAGHQRTLRDHTYRQRMIELVGMIDGLLSR